MKRFLSLFLALVITLSALLLASCGSEKEQEISIKDENTAAPDADSDNTAVRAGDTVNLLNGLTVAQTVEKVQTDYTKAENLKITQNVVVSVNGEQTGKAESVIIKSGENVYMKNDFGSEFLQTENWLVGETYYVKYGEMKYKLDLKAIKELLPEELDIEDVWGIWAEDISGCIPEFDPSDFADSKFTFDGDGYHADIVVDSEKISNAIKNSPASEYIESADIPDDIDIRYSFDLSGNLDRIEEVLNVEFSGEKAEIIITIFVEEITEDDFVDLPEDTESWIDGTSIIGFMSTAVNGIIKRGSPEK